jgi:hypothetical protein
MSGMFCADADVAALATAAAASPHRRAILGHLAFELRGDTGGIVIGGGTLLDKGFLRSGWNLVGVRTGVNASLSEATMPAHMPDRRRNSAPRGSMISPRRQEFGGWARVHVTLV